MPLSEPDRILAFIPSTKQSVAIVKCDDQSNMNTGPWKGAGLVKRYSQYPFILTNSVVNAL